MPARKAHLEVPSLGVIRREAGPLYSGYDGRFTNEPIRRLFPRAPPAKLRSQTLEAMLSPTCGDLLRCPPNLAEVAGCVYA